MEVDDTGGLRADVVRADVLAEVAAEEPVADFRPELQRDWAAIFYGEVGDAEAGINSSIRFYGLGRADIYAPSAGATLTLPSGRLVWGEIQCRDNFGEEDIRTIFAGDEEGVFADETHMGFRAVGALHDGSEVDVGFVR